MYPSILPYCALHDQVACEPTRTIPLSSGRRVDGLTPRAGTFEAAQAKTCLVGKGGLLSDKGSHLLIFDM